MADNGIFIRTVSLILLFGLLLSLLSTPSSAQMLDPNRSWPANTESIETAAQLRDALRRVKVTSFDEVLFSGAQFEGRSPDSTHQYWCRTKDPKLIRHVFETLQRFAQRNAKPPRRPYTITMLPDWEPSCLYLRVHNTDGSEPLYWKLLLPDFAIDWHPTLALLSNQFARNVRRTVAAEQQSIVAIELDDLDGVVLVEKSSLGKQSQSKSLHPQNLKRTLRYLGNTDAASYAWDVNAHRILIRLKYKDGRRTQFMMSIASKKLYREIGSYVQVSVADE